MGSKNKAKKSRRKKQREERETNLFESDETFAFIAGYTSAGVPFGITWEEMGAIEQRENGMFGEVRSYCSDEEVDLPFD